MGLDEANPDNDSLYDLLAAYHDNLAEGQDGIPEQLLLFPAELRTRFQRARSCLQRLDHDWRRLDCSAKETPPSFPLADGLEVTAMPAPSQIGRFEIVRELGRGGCGIVFLARDTRLHRQVALKMPHIEAFLSPQARQRFLREARAAAGLDHPNLVPVYEPGEEGALCFIVSAYCEGPSLAAWLAQQKEPVAPRVAAQLVHSVAEALAYTHNRGVLHRDIKPSNIMLVPQRHTQDGEGVPADLPYIPRLTDFGLAKFLEGTSSETMSGAVLGTPAYMAPEQAQGQREAVGVAADVYGLGAVLYELLTGVPPFQGATRLDTLRLVTFDEVRPPRALRPDMPADLETICLKCLEKEPGRRYASAGGLCQDLRNFLDRKPIATRSAGIWRRARQWASRGRVSALGSLAAVAVIAIIGAGLWYLNQPHGIIPKTPSTTADGLVTWYRGDGDTLDSGPAGNHGTLRHGATFGPGKWGRRSASTA